MITLTVYGGCGTIGGNKILLEDHAQDSRLFFDFGTSFKVREQYFEEYLNPRPGAGLLDLLEMDYGEYGHLLPLLEGIYREDLLPPGDLWSRYRDDPRYRELASLDGVLVSHAHVDHTGYLSFLRPEVPVYASAISAFTAKAIQDSGITDFEKEVCYLNPRVRRAGDEERDVLTPAKGKQQLRPFVFVDRPELDEAARNFWYDTPSRKRLDTSLAASAQTQTDGSACRVGRLPVRHFPVDHSVLGASAWAVETSAGWVVYTGDLRLHGTRSEDTERFISEARSLRPRALLCEGTRAPRQGEEMEREPPAVTEREVEVNAHREVAAEAGLVVADFGPRNIERLQAFLRIAQATGRTLVVLAKDAYLLKAMHLVDAAIPTVETEDALRIYCDLKSMSGLWEKQVRMDHKASLVLPDQIRANPNRFILCFSFWDVKNLIDIAPGGGRYVYSSSEAYTEEQRLDIRRLRNWLKHFGMLGVGLPKTSAEEETDAPDQFEPGEEKLHASGHAGAGDLVELVKEIRPQTLIPIHTENPRFFFQALAGEPVEIRVPEYAVPIELT